MVLNEVSYNIVRDLAADKLLKISASVTDPICGDFTFQSTEWHGLLGDVSQKVNWFIWVILKVFYAIIVLQSYSVVITIRDGELELARVNKEEPLSKSSSGLPRIM